MRSPRRVRRRRLAFRDVDLSEARAHEKDARAAPSIATLRTSSRRHARARSTWSARQARRGLLWRSDNVPGALRGPWPAPPRLRAKCSRKGWSSGRIRRGRQLTAWRPLPGQSAETAADRYRLVWQAQQRAATRSWRLLACWRARRSSTLPRPLVMDGCDVDVEGQSIDVVIGWLRFCVASLVRLASHPRELCEARGRARGSLQGWCFRPSARSFAARRSESDSVTGVRGYRSDARGYMFSGRGCGPCCEVGKCIGKLGSRMSADAGCAGGQRCSDLRCERSRHT